MNSAPISVVIPFFNGDTFLQRALDSVQNQILKPSEVILVDDGSPVALDPSQFSCGVPLRLVRHDVNRGIAAARNAGVAASREPWLAFLDQDDEWLPHKLADQWTAIVAKGDNAGRSVFYGRAVRLDSKGRELVWPRAATMKGLGKSPDHALRQMVLHGNPIPFITVVITREAWLAAGGFDEQLRGGSDDYAILLRLAAAGFIFWAEPRAIPVARRHETGANYSNSLRFLEDDIALVSGLGLSIPAMRSISSRGLAAAHYRAGRAMLLEDPMAARLHIRTALRLNPVFPRAIATGCLAYSPAPVRGLIDGIWQWIRVLRYRTKGSLEHPATIR